jgi:hypothetical protein
MSVADAKPRPDDAGQFINLKAFKEWADRKDGMKLPDWGTIRSDLPHLVRPRPDKLRHRLFITHRWDSIEHPDPTGWQLVALQWLGKHYEFRDSELCFWYDYMSLPQKPRDREANRIFSRGLDNIRKTVAECGNIALIGTSGPGEADDLRAMMTRGWIVFELMIARNNVKLPLPLYERRWGDRIDYGRAQGRSWDAVTPDIATLVPFDSAGLILAWFKSKGISCTNGTDLEKLAKLLHQELTQRHGAPFNIAFDVEMRVTQKQLDSLQILEVNGLSGANPHIYLRERRLANSDSVTEPPEWFVTFTRRPSMPQLDEWTRCESNELARRLIDPETMRSPMYPGIVWQMKGEDRMIRATLPNDPDWFDHARASATASSLKR